MTTTREAQLDNYMGTDFGTCPTCGARGEYREKRPNGNDTCVRGHVYPSASAVHMTREARLEAVIHDILDWRAEQSATEAYKKEAVFQRAVAALSTPATEPQGLTHIVDYTNWRGETARRVIRPIRMWWGKTERHPEEQWMLTAWDCEKDAIRDFAWQDMRPVPNPATSAAALAARPAPQPAADTRVVTVAWLEACVDALKYWNSGSADREIKEIRAIIEGGQDRG